MTKKLYIPRKDQPEVGQPTYGTDMRVIERFINTTISSSTDTGDVKQIIAGTNITTTPATGKPNATGAVKINASGGGGTTVKSCYYYGNKTITAIPLATHAPIGTPPALTRVSITTATFNPLTLSYTSFTVGWKFLLKSTTRKTLLFGNINYQFGLTVTANSVARIVMPSSPGIHGMDFMESTIYMYGATGGVAYAPTFRVPFYVKNTPTTTGPAGQFVMVRPYLTSPLRGPGIHLTTWRVQINFTLIAMKL